MGTPLRGARLQGAMLLTLAVSASCTTVVQQGPGAGVVAQLSVERFLDAARTRDLDSMGRLFGTTDGPIIETGGSFGCFFKKIGSLFGGHSCVKRRDVEVRLDAIAQVLSHEDYKISGEEQVAGRLGEAIRIYVDFTVRGESVTRVPFVVVREKNGQWLVEQVDLQRMMARG